MTFELAVGLLLIYGFYWLMVKDERKERKDRFR